METISFSELSLDPNVREAQLTFLECNLALLLFRRERYVDLSYAKAQLLNVVELFNGKPSDETERVLRTTPVDTKRTQLIHAIEILRGATHHHKPFPPTRAIGILDEAYMKILLDLNIDLGEME